MPRARTIPVLPAMPAARPVPVNRRSWLATGLLVFGAVWLLALLTYDSADPSLDTATGRSPTNLAGYAGAILADAALQGIGLAGLIPGLAAIANAWRMLIGRGRPRLALRTLAALFGTVPVAGLLAVAGPRDWPAAVGSGGVVGTALARRVAEAVAPFGLAGGFVAMIAGAALACALTLLAFGLTASDWRRLGTTSARAARFAAEGAAKGAARGAETLGQMSGRIRVSPSDRLGAFVRADEPEDEPPKKSWWRRDRADPPEEAPAPDTVVRVTPDVSSSRAPKPDAPPPVVAARPPRVTAKRPGTVTPRQESLPLTEDAWRPPSLSLLAAAPVRAQTGPSAEALQANARLLETVLADYGVQGSIVEIRPGPVVTLYELEPAPGIRSARVIGLADDVARSLSVTAVRIATVSGRNVIGIEVPNAKRETVYLSELLGNDEWAKNAGRLTLALGKDIGGEPVLADLARMPHLMIAGTTGSGKSVGVNAMILSLLFRLSPEQCRLILIDPKMLELSVYDGIPHLMAPVVTEPKKAVVALKWTVREMERRYRSMSQLGVRNIGGFNDRVAEARAKGEVVTRRVQTGFDADTGRPVFEDQPLALEPLPLIVVVVDEMADLMMVAGKEIEAAVQRLAQMARAAGIHVIMATQRPSVDVITGTIKANFPTRISFQVISKFDSRTILGEQGAEQLLGMGDMLYMVGGGRITRVHGPFVTDREVEDVVAYLRTQGEPAYLDAVTETDDFDAEPALSGIAGGPESEKTLFDQAVAVVAREGKASTSFIQRHLAIGYNRAAKLIEQMEKEGIISAANHSGKREVLVRHTGDDE